MNGGGDCDGSGGAGGGGYVAGPVERSCSAPTGSSCGLAYLLYRTQSPRG